MKRRKAAYPVEALESRMLLTTILLPAAPQHAVVANFGSIHGTYGIQQSSGVDAGITDNFSGHGRIDLLGSVHLSGSLTGVGNIAHGQANGEITLANARGTITLDLVGPDQSSFSPLPHQFQFSVVNATGAFKNFQLIGTVHLTQNPAKKTFAMSFVSVEVYKAPLAGTGHGDFTVGFPVADAGSTYNLNGTASLGLMDQVNLSGSIQSTGFIQSGKATGQLTLSNEKGTVVLQLTGPVQSGFAPLPKQFSYTVLSATGAYHGLNSTGSISLTLDPIMWLDSPLLIWHPMPVQGGTFNLTIHPNAG